MARLYTKIVLWFVTIKTLQNLSSCATNDSFQGPQYPSDRGGIAKHDMNENWQFKFLLGRLAQMKLFKNNRRVNNQTSNENHRELYTKRSRILRLKEKGLDHKYVSYVSSGLSEILNRFHKGAFAYKAENLNPLVIIHGLSDCGLFAIASDFLSPMCSSTPATWSASRIWISILGVMPPERHQACWATTLAVYNKSDLDSSKQMEDNPNSNNDKVTNTEKLENSSPRDGKNTKDIHSRFPIYLPNKATKKCIDPRLFEPLIPKNVRFLSPCLNVNTKILPKGIKFKIGHSAFIQETNAQGHNAEETKLLKSLDPAPKKRQIFPPVPNNVIAMKKFYPNTRIEELHTYAPLDGLTVFHLPPGSTKSIDYLDSIFDSKPQYPYADDEPKLLGETIKMQDDDNREYILHEFVPNNFIPKPEGIQYMYHVGPESRVLSGLKQGGKLMLNGIDFLPYMAHFSKALKAQGYIDNNNILAWPYDWRLPTFNQEMDSLVKLIEETQLRTGRKVALMCHSMGCNTIMFFLNVYVSDEWKQKYVAKLISMNGAYGGSVISVLCLLFGFHQYTMSVVGIEIRPITEQVGQFLKDKIPSLMQLIALPSIFGTEDPVVQTIQPDGSLRPYDSATWVELLPDDMANQIRILQNEWAKILVKPTIPVYCLTSELVGDKTPVSVKVPYNNITDTAATIIQGRGDGTVPLTALRFCDRIATDSIHYIGPSHTDILGWPDAIRDVFHIVNEGNLPVI